MKHALLCLIIVVLLAAPTAAGADDPARQGTFTVTITQHGSWEGFEVGHRHWVWIARRSGVFEGNGPLAGLTQHCVSKGRTLFGSSEAEVHCENVDNAGDRIFETSTETGDWARGGRGGTGSGEFLGGTGQYDRIRGTFSIERRVGPRDEAARTWTDYVTATGSWELP